MELRNRIKIDSKYRIILSMVLKSDSHCGKSIIYLQQVAEELRARRRSPQNNQRRRSSRPKLRFHTFRGIYMINRITRSNNRHLMVEAKQAILIINLQLGLLRISREINNHLNLIAGKIRIYSAAGIQKRKKISTRGMKRMMETMNA